MGTDDGSATKMRGSGGEINFNRGSVPKLVSREAGWLLGSYKQQPSGGGALQMPLLALALLGLAGCMGSSLC